MDMEKSEFINKLAPVMQEKIASDYPMVLLERQEIAAQLLGSFVWEYKDVLEIKDGVERNIARRAIEGRYGPSIFEALSDGISTENDRQSFITNAILNQAMEVYTEWKNRETGEQLSRK